MGFSGLNVPSPTRHVSGGAALTLDTSGGFWAPVCQWMDFLNDGVTVIPVYDNYIVDNATTMVTATEFELYAVRD